MRQTSSLSQCTPTKGEKGQSEPMIVEGATKGEERRGRKKGRERRERRERRESESSRDLRKEFSADSRK